jgi:hypothetical protein
MCTHWQRSSNRQNSIDSVNVSCSVADISIALSKNNQLQARLLIHIDATYYYHIAQCAAVAIVSTHHVEYTSYALRKLHAGRITSKGNAVKGVSCTVTL